MTEGLDVGRVLGNEDGNTLDGITVGDRDGIHEGLVDGTQLGIHVGVAVVTDDGKRDGT